MIQLKRNKSHHFYIECNHCKHNAMVPVTSLLNHYGDNITSDEVLRRARCTSSYLCYKNAVLAPWLNWIERPPPKGQVIGSNPIGVAK